MREWGVQRCIFDLLMRETDMCRATITSGSLIVVTTYQSGYQSDAYERGGVSVKRTSSFPVARHWRLCV